MAIDIKGTDFALSLKRTTKRPLDASSVFATLDNAVTYAANDDTDDYCPYNGQVISVSGTGRVYVLRSLGTVASYTYEFASGGNNDGSYKKVVTFTKTTDRTHFYLDEVKGGSQVDDEYLSRNKDDSNSHHTLTVGDLVIDSTNEVGEDGTRSNGSITNKENGDKSFSIGQKDGHSQIDIHTVNATNANASGNVTVGNNLTISGNTTLYGDISGKASSGSNEGWSIKKDGDTYVFTVGKIKATETEVTEVQFVGGKIVVTQGQGIKVTAVDGLKCYFDSNDTPCFLREGDYGLCDRYEDGVSSRTYWREITSVNLVDNYIILSSTSCQSGSAMPSVGDTIVHLGNKTSGSSRASAIIIDSTTIPPSICEYENINTFTLPDPNVKLSSTENIFTGKVNATASDGTSSDVSSLIKDLQDAVTNEYDNEFIIWKAEYEAPKDSSGNAVSTLSSSAYAPSKDWTSAEIINHGGDYLITTDGFVYQLKRVSSVFSWYKIEEQYLNKAIKDSRDALLKATSVEESIAEMASDTYITYTEYSMSNGLSFIWEDTKAEYNDIVSKLTTGTVKTAYVTAYNNLSTYMQSIETHFSTSSTAFDVKNGQFESLWSAYNTARTNAQSEIQSSIDSGISNAQTTANTAQNTANTAQSTANDAQTTANNANTTASNAQTTAENAQNIANAKVSIFSSATRPTPPYKIGDRWIKPAYVDGNNLYSDEEYYCQQGRESGEGLATDWTLLTNKAALTIESNAIKLAVQDNIKENIIEITDNGVQIKSSKNGNKVSLISVDADGNVMLNGSLIKVSGDQIDLSGKTISISSTGITKIESTNFNVDSDGKITASNANISGAITATSGSFTGDIYADKVFAKDASTDEYVNLFNSGLQIVDGVLNIEGKIVTTEGAQLGGFTVDENGNLFAGDDQHTILGPNSISALCDAAGTSKFHTGMAAYANTGAILYASSMISNVPAIKAEAKDDSTSALNTIGDVTFNKHTDNSKATFNLPVVINNGITFNKPFTGSQQLRIKSVSASTYTLDDNYDLVYFENDCTVSINSNIPVGRMIYVYPQGHGLTFPSQIFANRQSSSFLNNANVHTIIKINSTQWLLGYYGL